MFAPAAHPHRRRDLLTRDRLPVSSHRTKRPWQGDMIRAGYRTPAGTEPLITVERPAAGAGIL